MKLLILADNNNAIACNGEQIVFIDNDLEMFKNYTTNNIVVMGRRTFDAIGKQLPNRVSVVFTRKKIENKKDLFYVNSIEELDKLLENYPDKEVYLIGGAEVINLLWDKLDTLLITRVDMVVDKADTFIPKFEGFELVNKTKIDDPKYNVYHEIWKKK